MNRRFRVTVVLRMTLAAPSREALTVGVMGQLSSSLALQQGMRDVTIDAIEETPELLAQEQAEARKAGLFVRRPDA